MSKGDSQMQDKLMPVIQVQNLDDVRPFYLEVLGFEEGAAPPNLAGQFSAFSYGSSNIAVSTPSGLPSMPKAAAGTAMIVIEVPDAVGIRNVMAKRHEQVVGPVESGWWGAFFDVSDPLGNVFRFLQKSETIAYEGSDGSAPPMTSSAAPAADDEAAEESAAEQDSGPIEGDS